MQLSAGTLVGGEFELVRPLGQGGMGVVYLAVQRSTGLRRALKTMHAHLLRDETLLRRFEREARVGSLIASDHVVQVVASGVDDTLGKLPWFAMELLDGVDLGRYLRARGALSLPEATELFAQVAHALGAAHRAGVVHRDLKAENVFLATTRMLGMPNIVKVLDFGIAKWVSEAAPQGRTLAMGTPLCMAPEQAGAGGTVNPTTDVWAFGLLVFHVLVGRSYWRAARDDDERPAEILRELVLDPLVSASERAAEYLSAHPLPEGFDPWFAQCVVRDQTQRFRDMSTAWELLRPVLASQPRAQSPAGGQAPQAPRLNTVSLPRLQASPPEGLLGAAPTLAAQGLSSEPQLRVRVTYRERFRKTAIAVPVGSTLLAASQEHGLSHFAQCGGQARCTTCRVLVVDGLEKLGPRTEDEQKVADKKRWASNIRLACQARVLGDVTVRRLVLDQVDAHLAGLEAPAQGPLVERPAVVLVCTLRQFASFSAQNYPYDIAHVLQRFSRQLLEPIAHHGGRAQRFEDGVLTALFGHEDARLEDAAIQGLRAALRMQLRLKPFNEYLGQHYGHAFSLGIALHAGPVLVGNVGSEEWPLPCLLGETIELARAVEAAVGHSDAKLMVTDAFRSLLGTRARYGRALGTLTVPAGGASVELAEVLDFSVPDMVFLVQSSFELLVPRGDDFVRAFYARLFDGHPEVEQLFDQVDAELQRTMLLKILASVVHGLERFDTLVPSLRQLGQRHLRYGARAEHYRLVGQALLDALGEILGSSFGPEVELAWRELYGMLARTMIDATREPVTAPGLV